jgi:hypothetical protein
MSTLKHTTTMMLFTILFALLALFGGQVVNAQSEHCGKIIEITSGNQLAPNITWTVPESEKNSYFVFNVELWASSGRSPATERKVADLGETRTGQDGNGGQHYHLTADLPEITPGQQTSYYIAVYGRKYEHGPAMTSIHPWDLVYYGTQSVYLNQQTD